MKPRKIMSPDLSYESVKGSRCEYGVADAAVHVDFAAS